jgi:hypothetical protein
MTALERLMETAAVLTQRAYRTKEPSSERTMRAAAETIRQAVAAIKRSAEGDAARAARRLQQETGGHPQCASD